MKDINAFGNPEILTLQKWWEFIDQPPTHSLSLETVTAEDAAGGDTAATLVGVIPQDSRIVGAFAVASINSAGIDASNKSTWVVNIGGTAALTLDSEADFVANASVDMGAPAHTDASAGDAVTLAITNGTTADLNSALCHVSLVLADYQNFPAPGLTVVATDGGTAAIADGVKGIVALSPGVSDHDEIYMSSSTEIFKFAADAVFIGEALVQFTEAATDDANIIFGFMNAVGADALVDDGAGPRATGDYLAIWKVDGSTVWRAGAQSNGTQKPLLDVDSEVTAGGSPYQLLRIKVVCSSSTQARADFTVDGVLLATVHFDYASATEMQLFVGAKNGGGNAETLNVDYLGFAVNR